MSKRKTELKKVQDLEPEEVALPKNPKDFTYEGDEILPLKASTFFLLLKAIDKALQKGSRLSYPIQEEFVSSLDGSLVENPSKEQLISGEVRATVSVDKTFSPENLKEEFEAWIMPEIATAKQELLALHAEAVSKGIAKKRIEESK